MHNTWDEGVAQLESSYGAATAVYGTPLAAAGGPITVKPESAVLGLVADDSTTTLEAINVTPTSAALVLTADDAQLGIALEPATATLTLVADTSTVTVGVVSVTPESARFLLVAETALAGTIDPAAMRRQFYVDERRRTYFSDDVRREFTI